MRLVFLRACAADLRWFRSYYVSVFPEGADRAVRQFRAVQDLLKSNPFIGHPSDRVEGAREFKVLRTPFTVVYRLRDDRIEVLRVLDSRADLSTESETQE